MTAASKPFREKVLPSTNSSWRFWRYEGTSIPFNWHYHPEYEITLTLNSHGHRYVGDCIEQYEELDLVFVGPNLPHTWCSHHSLDGQTQPVYVAQIPASWLESMTDTMPEFEGVRHLLALSKRGVKFSYGKAKEVLNIFDSMHTADPMKRFIGLMEVLKCMLEEENPVTLSSSSFSFTLKNDIANDKIEKVIQYIHDHYTENLTADQLADVAHMSTNHFHRFIKQRTEQTFTELVNQLRVGKACSLLINSDLPISTISDLSGFNNTSNFNRRFLQFKKCTPSQFRKAFSGKMSRKAAYAV
ncbi:AraC family transcriptional regulator [Teredinibacter sp. KSP-S5-2]|uniref:AraC family transcriptional regulator n=1 Tax=Teredinibacter sp. KSP-S5-2 TaxID=3034506 RepID=UPI0029345B62|nr:AraC family transcriptional regulator [Teredinibacter sp. KSP-S5-2]WNO08561.1 AraC family transcriptional regulator [Teredinibacter sp. KSP-S5-2]